LYIASPDKPDLTHLVEQAGWPTSGTWDTRDYQPLLKRLAARQRWAFRLTANPARSTRTKDGEPTKPRGHVTAAQQQAWLLTRAERHGFTVPIGKHDAPDLVVRDRGVVRFSRRDGDGSASSDGGRRVVISVATYDGILEVVDSDAMRFALTHGIGRAKGYGCGLLTLARLT
jgi:CRISPR system Cascade subunit CasE